MPCLKQNKVRDALHGLLLQLILKQQSWCKKTVRLNHTSWCQQLTSTVWRESWHSLQTYFHYTSSVNLDQMWFWIQRLTVRISGYTHLAPLNVFRALKPSNHFMASADGAFAAFCIWKGPVVGDQYQTTNQLHWMTGFVLPKSQTEKQQCKLLEQCLQLRSNFHTYLLLPTTTFCKFQHSRLPGDGQSWDLTSGASTSHTCFGPGEDSHKLDGNSRSEEQEKAAGMEQMNFKQVQKPEMGITQVPHK